MRKEVFTAGEMLSVSSYELHVTIFGDDAASLMEKVFDEA